MPHGHPRRYILILFPDGDHGARNAALRETPVFLLQLAVSDSKLGNAIKEKLSIKCVNDTGVMEVMRGIRGQLEALLASVGDDNLRAMRLGLSHSLSRYKLKFSADKVRVLQLIQGRVRITRGEKQIPPPTIPTRENTVLCLSGK